jgi:hypothetical protein
MTHLVLLVAALVLFILAAVGVAHPRVSLQSAGLACLAGAFIASRYGI